MDWQAWHDDYDVPDSPLYRRLLTVQAHVRRALDSAPQGPLRVVSACAGQGRDLLDVLAEHPRREDVTAWLVELDPQIAALAERTSESMGLRGVEVVVGDAGLTRQYRGMVPADEEQGFERQWLSQAEERWGVGVHRFVGQPSPLAADRRMFTFV